jgi:hypothetical protein
MCETCESLVARLIVWHGCAADPNYAALMQVTIEKLSMLDPQAVRQHAVD